MRHLKMLGLAAIAAVAAMAFVGASSAMAESTALCKVSTSPCPEKSLYPSGTVIKAQLLPGTESLLLGPEPESKIEVQCTGSTSEGKTTGASLANPLTGELTSLAFSGCTYGAPKTPACEVNVEKLGVLTLLKTAVNLGEAKVTGVLVTVTCAAVLKCTYTTEALPLHAKGTGPSGEVAELTASKAPLVQEGVGVGCPAKGFFDAKYEITSPTPIFITS